MFNNLNKNAYGETGCMNLIPKKIDTFICLT